MRIVRGVIYILLLSVLFIAIGCSDGAKAPEAGKLSVVDSLLHKADSLFNTSNPAGAISLQLQAYMKTANKDIRARIQTNLAKSHFLIGNIGITKNLLLQAINHYDTTKSTSDTLLTDKMKALTLYSDVLIKEENFSEAIRQLSRAATIAKKTGDKQTYISCMMDMMLNEEYNGNFGSAIDGYRDMLNYCDPEDVKSRFNICNKLHGIFLSLGNTDDADIYLNTMKRLVGPNDKLARYLVDIAEMNQARYEKDTKRVEACVGNLRKDVNDPYLIENGYNNALSQLGEYYMSINMFDSARYYINRFLETAKLNNIKGQLGLAYLIHTESLIHDNQLDSARKILFDESITKICNNSVEMGARRMKLISDFYFKSNNFKESYKYRRLASSTSDSIRAEVISHNFAYRDMAHQRDTTIMTNSIRINQKQSRIEDLAFWHSIWLFVIIFAVIGSIIVALRIAVDMIKEREKAIHQQNLILQHEVLRRTTILQSQKIELERTNERLNKEIEYASRIQNDILPSDSMLESPALSSQFVYYRPCAHISGDFYWFNKIGNKLIVCCADATGHGIPGAFVAMVCSTMLNDIYSRIELDAAAIMTALDDNMRAILMNNSNGRSNDSVDMSIVCIDEATGEIEMSLARHNSYIARNDGTLDIVHGVKRSIGDLDEAFIARPFTTQKINVNSGDTIFLTTDGLESQFGGEDGQKLKRQRMTRLIQETAQKDGKEMMPFLDKSFKEWKGDNEQTDDVLVIGLRIK
ncbi:MAG: SpoIIE family protein phosphatase [Bacteroidales bacterium]|nr:SpoIIE family protein phosphatase [Bacteroidales bacterium]